MNVLITGTAGFIGFYLSQSLARQGYNVYGIDTINDYYATSLKYDRLKACGIVDVSRGKEIASTLFPNYRFQQADLCDKEKLDEIFHHNQFDCVINLAAQAGVRYSLINPGAYIESNVVGFVNILELCRKYACDKLIYASSSSVYGNSSSVPFKETDQVDTPVSIYAATKKSNELMAYTYAHLYRLKTVGLRFFTVYGPYGRPDMAPILFAKAIKNNETIKIFNNGELARDFTYINDIVEGIAKIVAKPELVRESTPGVPAVVYNIGHGAPVNLMDFVCILENKLGKTAQKEFVGMQPGDVYQTWADTTRLKEDYQYVPTTTLEEGISCFAQWFTQYY